MGRTLLKAFYYAGLAVGEHCASTFWWPNRVRLVCGRFLCWGDMLDSVMHIVTLCYTLGKSRGNTVVPQSVAQPKLYAVSY